MNITQVKLIKVRDMIDGMMRRNGRIFDASHCDKQLIGEILKEYSDRGWKVYLGNGNQIHFQEDNKDGRKVLLS